MDIRQLKYFLAIAREGQITRAARSLNMEQPPLSRQLKQLEQELGVLLFDRSGQQLRLTHAGELLQQRAEQLLRQLNETVQEVKEVEEGLQGVLAIGSVVSCISLLPPAIEQFHRLYPRVTFKILEGDHYLLAEQLEQRSIELIASRLPFETPYQSDSYAIARLPSDPFVAVVPQSWDLRAGKHRLPLEVLKSLPFLTLKTDQTTGMHDRVMNEFRRHGFEPEVLCECSSVAVILALVAAGIGVTVLPESVMSSFPLPQIQVVPIADTQLLSEVGIVWRKDRYLSKGAERFIQSLVPQNMEK